MSEELKQYGWTLMCIAALSLAYMVARAFGVEPQGVPEIVLGGLIGVLSRPRTPTP